jgi:hypothetical protein
MRWKVILMVRRKDSTFRGDFPLPYPNIPAETEHEARRIAIQHALRRYWVTIVRDIQPVEVSTDERDEH